MRKELHIDVETFSSIPITAGLHRYMEADDFHIQLLSYAFDDEPVKTIDLFNTRDLEFDVPDEFLSALADPSIVKWAHNAAFERNVFGVLGYPIPKHQIRCSMVLAGRCGLPLSLDDLSEALGLTNAKLKGGTQLINTFSKPNKPTKQNGMSGINSPFTHPEKWELYKEYNRVDVESERELTRLLKSYIVPTEFDEDVYYLDQDINDRGIAVDTSLAENAIECYVTYRDEKVEEMKKITGLQNPKSGAQLKGYLSDELGEEITSLTKDAVSEMLQKDIPSHIKHLLKLHQNTSKSSITKYKSMLEGHCEDKRARGLFQFYGATRTGRWAGRRVQLQNLPRNKMPDKDLTLARGLLKDKDYDLIEFLFGKTPYVLSELIRTSFIAKEGHTFAISDFSAIEARVIAWLADEEWRLEVFRTHGKIYEATAAKLYKKAFEDIGKGSIERDTGKVAELAFGYGGGKAAMKKFGAEALGFTDSQMESFKVKWREDSPNIVKFWRDLEKCAINAVMYKRSFSIPNKKITFNYDGINLTATLPSGRKLYYYNPRIVEGKFGGPSIEYMGKDDTTKKWVYISTYGGKLAENVTQAVARDCLAVSMLRINKKGLPIVMHVHDESVCEVLLARAEKALETMNTEMAKPIEWAPDLPLTAEGFISPYYKKD